MMLHAVLWQRCRHGLHRDHHVGYFHRGQLASFHDRRCELRTSPTCLWRFCRHQRESFRSLPHTSIPPPNERGPFKNIGHIFNPREEILVNISADSFAQRVIRWVSAGRMRSIVLRRGRRTLLSTIGAVRNGRRAVRDAAGAAAEGFGVHQSFNCM